MNCMRLGLALASILATVAVSSARAGDCCAPAPCAPAFRTVCVTEWVPENYQCTRTSYKTECRQESYTVNRCEWTCETRTRNCVTYKQVPEVKTVTRNVCVSVPCCEERTVMQTFVSCKPVTQIVRRCVDKGHWECREVPCPPTLCDRIKACCCRKSCCNDCCEPCCRTKTVRCWVPCPVVEECPVTVMQRVCECRPVTCKVQTCKTEIRQEQYQVCCYKCVPETHVESYQVQVPKYVPCTLTRTVQVCVPVQETVTLCRMVPRVVQKQVPCEQPSCCNVCCAPACCKISCCKKCCK